MARINYFYNWFPFQDCQLRQFSNNELNMHLVYIPGSLSFNSLVVPISVGATINHTYTISFGLYSISGSTLSLANSASYASNDFNNSFWKNITDISATQDITPGNWFFAYIITESSNNPRVNNIIFQNATRDYSIDVNVGGPFVRGRYSVTTNGFPASIATSDMSKIEDSSATNPKAAPLLIISA